MKIVIDISKHRFGEPKDIAKYGSIKIAVDIISDPKAKEELCRRENTLWNLIHDVEIKCVKLGKG